MDATELLRDRIALTLINGIGNQFAKTLTAYAGSEADALKLSHKRLQRIPGFGPERAKMVELSIADALKRADQEIQFIGKHKIKAVHYSDPDYPELLLECADCPFLLYMRGNIELKDKKMLAVVGTRMATDYGRQMIKEVLEELATRHPDLVIISGLAYGIDIAAHRTAIACHLPTIGLMGNGFATIYPSEHRHTAVKMLEQGGLITEFISTAAPDRRNFLMRNRIIAGMSHATWVVESAIRGGSLITADMANSYNRDVFACPGRLHDPYSIGCNKLIKSNKASLIESAADIEYIMGWENNQRHAKSPSQPVYQLTEEEQRLHLFLRSHDKITLDELAQNTQQNVHLLSAMLLTLEFKGAVRCLPGNRYSAL